VAIYREESIKCSIRKHLLERNPVLREEQLGFRGILSVHWNKLAKYFISNEISKLQGNTLGIQSIKYSVRIIVIFQRNINYLELGLHNGQD